MSIKGKINTKKKALFILPHLNGGGAERVALNYLRQIDKDKFEVFLMVFDKTSDLLHLVSDDVTLINLDTKKVSKSLPKLVKAIKNIKPDLVFTTHYTVAFLLHLAKVFTPKFKHLARIPGSPKSEQNHNYYGSFKRKLFGIGLRSAQINIAQTSEMLEEAVEIFRLDRSKCIVLSNPLDTELIDNSIKGSKQLFDTEKYNIVACGRLHPVKGYDLLIKAVQKLNKNRPNIQLHILGSDKGSESELIDLVKQLNLEETVSFLGFIENPFPYYLQCDLFVLSSIHEGFPNALLENYYLNTPIVGTKCAKIVETLICEGRNGYLCEVSNIESLFKSMECVADLNRTMIKNESYKGSDINFLLKQL